MQAPPRPTRTRASGGRTLILLGVLLALAAGAIVIYVVSSFGSGPQQTETVVVAAVNLNPGEVLSATQTGAVATGTGDTATTVTYDRIDTVFTTKLVNVDFAPTDAYIYHSQNDLNSLLNNKTVYATFIKGDILRNNDPRLAATGNAAPGSLVAINPGKLGKNDVLVAIKVDGKPAMVPGDTVDVIDTQCVTSGGQSDCLTQTTLSQLYVYAVAGSSVYVVATEQQAVQLQFLTTSSSNYELAIRGSKFTATPSTTPVDQNTIISTFKFK